MDNIYLIGMRGVGKSTIGKAFSKRMGREFVDLDDQITAKAGKEIPKIVSVEGWDGFREREHEAVQDIVQKEMLIVGTGGGVLMHFNNAQLLKDSGKLILLVAEPPALVQRIKDSHQRPSLTGKDALEEIAEVWGKRKDTYYRVADLVVNTEPWDEDRILGEILGFVKSFS